MRVLGMSRSPLSPTAPTALKGMLPAAASSEKRKADSKNSCKCGFCLMECKIKKNKVLKEFYYVELKDSEAAQNKVQILEPQISLDRSKPRRLISGTETL